MLFPSDDCIFEGFHARECDLVVLRVASEFLEESAVVVAQRGEVPSLFARGEGRHLAIKAVHVIVKDVGMQEVAVGVDDVGEGHHRVAVQGRVFLLQNIIGYQNLVQRSYQPRSEKGEIKVPVFLA